MSVHFLARDQTSNIVQKWHMTNTNTTLIRQIFYHSIFCKALGDVYTTTMHHKTIKTFNFKLKTSSLEYRFIYLPGIVENSINSFPIND